MYILECDIKIEELEMKILALEAKEKYQQYFLFTITAWNGCGIKPIQRFYLLQISVHLDIYVNQHSFQ